MQQVVTWISVFKGFARQARDRRSKLSETTMEQRSPTQHVSRRILFACADDSLRERVSSQLRDCGLEVFAAEDERVAIAQFGRQSFPVLITDRMLGSLDGTELVRQVRCISIEPVYVLMMTDNNSLEEMNMVYCAGVDLFMPRSVTVSLLKERVQAAFKAISLRRTSRVQGTASEVVTVDLASGAHTARHLVGRLSAEIELARRSQGTLEIAIVRIGSPQGEAIATEDLLAAVEAVQTSLRAKFDWMAWLHPVGHSHRLAVVMPNAGRGGAAALEQHVRNAFVLETTSRQRPELSFGHVLFEPRDANMPTALGLLAQAEQHLRSLGPARSAAVAAKSAIAQSGQINAPLMQ